MTPSAKKAGSHARARPRRGGHGPPRRPVRGRQSRRRQRELERLLAEQSVRLLHRLGAETDDAVRGVLRLLGRGGEWDRVVVVRWPSRKGGDLTSHEWCGQGIPSLSAAAGEGTGMSLPWLTARIRRGDTVHLRRLDDLPSEAGADRLALERQGVRSLLAVPLRSAGDVLGLVRFDCVRRRRRKPVPAVRLLERAGRLLGSALARQQADRLLQESERRFRHLFENSPDAIFVESFEGVVLDVNPAACRLHGRRREDLVGKHVLDLVPPDCRDQVARDFPRLVEGSLAQAEGYSLTAGGEAVPVELRVSRTEYLGQPALLLHVRDIRKRRQAEEALRRQQREQQVLFDSVPAMIWFKDVHNRLLRVNRAAAEQLGLRVGETEKFSDVAAAAEGLRHHPLDREVIRTGLPKLGVTEPLFTATGQTRWLQTDRFPYRDEQGRIIGVIVFAQDITERKRMEDGLRESEERYRTVVESARDAIFTMSPQGYFTSLNATAGTFTGYAVDEWIGKPFSKIVHPEDLPLVQAMHELVLSGSPTPLFEVRVRTREGSYVVLEIKATPQMHRDTVIGIFGIGRDVTERKRLEEQFRQSQKMEAIGLLAGGVAHDFNNMLSAIMGYAEISLGQVSPGDRLYKNILEIMNAAERAAALTRQLLAFSRRQVMEARVFDLNEVVTSVEGMLRRLIGEPVELVTILSPTPMAVKADPGQIEQVIMNLVVNARDAMPRGGRVTIRTDLVEFDSSNPRLHEDLPAGPYVCLAISDTGTGMTEEVRSHLFEPFFTTKEKGHGTGLGLATCYGIIKQSGGHIQVHTELGHGSTFEVYLPLVRDAAESLRCEETPLSLPRGRERVLVVEDEQALRELTCLILADLGYSVSDAPDGEQALQQVRQDGKGPFDLLITDVIMPQMGGRELAERLRELSPSTRVLFTSGYSDDALAHHGILNPGVALLAKPFTMAALAHKVREVLDQPPT